VNVLNVLLYSWMTCRYTVRTDMIYFSLVRPKLVGMSYGIPDPLFSLQVGRVQQRYRKGPDAEFLDEIQTKDLRAFLLAIHSYLYSFALRLIFLQTHATSYSFYSSVTVLKEKGGTLDKKPCPLSYCLRNPYRNLKSENSQDMPRNLNKIVCS
jgi:hypothetical protein